MSVFDYLNTNVTVKIDRPLHSLHPKHGFVYELNYGFVPNTISGDGEELDAYVLGVDTPLETFSGRCIGLIRRTDDDDDKLIIAPIGQSFCDEDIERLTAFQEKWFKHILICKAPSVHLICGFMGFGKTTLAKKLEKELPAVRFTHDEVMLRRFGRTPENFAACCQEVDAYILQAAETTLKNGQNVILDYGFWRKDDRKKYYDWAKALTPDVVFDILQCDLQTAKKRVLERTQNNPDELYIDEGCFNDRLKKFEPFSESEKLPARFYSS